MKKVGVNLEKRYREIFGVDASDAIIHYTWWLQDLLHLIDERLPKADDACDEPEISFVEAVIRELRDTESSKERINL